MEEAEKAWLKLCSTKATGPDDARAFLARQPSEERLLRARCPASGFTALHWAAKLGNAPLARFLLTADPDLLPLPAQGLTPLHVASMQVPFSPLLTGRLFFPAS